MNAYIQIPQPALPKAYRVRSQHLIDGKLVDPEGGTWFDAVDPCTGAVVAQIAEGNAADIDRAVKSARAAFEGPWSKFKPSERQSVLLKLADLIEAEFDDIALVDTLEMGRPITPSLFFKSMIARAIRHCAGKATAIHGQTMGNSSPVELLSYTLREPVGVVGAIIPWNGPIFCAAWKCAPALAAGCTVVLKPSEKGSLTPIRFGELCLDAGIPPGVVNVVTGHGAAGAALVDHPDVDKITFTGSCGTGQKIIQASAGTIRKRVTMELGGKSPNIVFADADLDLAVPAAGMAIFNNSGQVCSAGSRIFVERAVHDEFVARLAEFGKSLKIGHTLDPATQIGPIVSRGQFDRVCSYLDLGPQEGVQVALGGAALMSGGFESGFFVPPTIFGAARDDMRVTREEIFGPVACVLPFDAFDEVIARANDTEFGLAAAVWTRDITRAHQAVKRIRAGTVWVNHYGAMDPAVPFGGYKMSGYGREGGDEHVESYLQTKGVWIRTA